MKTITKSIRLLAFLFVLLTGKAMYAQTCTANFVYTLNPNGAVTFSSTSFGTNSITTQYYWTFGNGNTFTAVGSPMASQIYTANGTYVVNLFFITVPSCSAAISQTIVINNANGCNLNANFSNSGGNGTISFFNTTVGTNTNTTYSWNFGNGNTSTAFAPVATYTAAGNYLVSLTASNGGTCVSTYTAMVNVCILNGTFSTSTGPNGQIYMNSTTANTNSLTMYSWTVTGSNYAVGSGASGPSYSVTVPANGIYTVGMYVSNGNCFSIVFNTVSVSGVTCNLNASFNTTYGANGLVNFNSTSTGTTGGSSYLYSFGNGQFATTPNANTTYTANGTYNVIFHVSSGGNPLCNDSIAAVVTVTNATGNPCNLNANFTYSLLPNGQVNFYNTSTGTSSITSYGWSFGNGQIGTTANPSTTYTANGTYQVILYVSNGPACMDSVVHSVNISNLCNLSASFAYSVSANGSVSFNSTSLGTNSATTYYWNYGDGTSGTGPVNTHIYASAGNYNVILIAMNGSSLCANSSTQSINVTGIPCLANSNFSLVPTNTPQFWSAFPAFPWNVTNAVWSWGDGSTSNLLYTSHTYSAAGMYNICLTVTVSCGSSASTCATYSISKLSSNNQIIYVNVEEPAIVPVGIENISFEALQFNLYPNPNAGDFTLQLNKKVEGKLNVAIYNLMGVEIYKNELNPNEASSEIHLNEVANGIYFARVNQGTQTFIQKFVISK